MLVLISTICAILAAWLWTSATTPSQRLANLLPVRTSRRTSSYRPRAPLALSRRPRGAVRLGTGRRGAVRLGTGRGAVRLRTGRGVVRLGTGLRGAAPRRGELDSDALSSPLWPSTDGPFRTIRPGPEEPPSPAWLDEPPAHLSHGRVLIPATCAGLVVGLLIGGFPGVTAAVLITPVAAVILRRRESPELQRDHRRISVDLPFAADLMAACLLAGQPVSAATQATATAIGGPLGHRLSWVSAQLRLGADPEPTWAFLARDPAMAQLSRAMSRAAQSGAPVADVLTRLADDARDATRATSVAAARSVGVKAVAPLGLCFLPAFVLLGIVPVVAGLASAIILP